VGFEYEGTQRRGWCLDGTYFDIHHMARISDAWDGLQNPRADQMANVKVAQ
jgi:hypothetical protein